MGTPITTLAAALPAAEFVEHHCTVVEAPPDRVWDALHATTWAELRLTRPLMLARGLGLRRGRPVPLLGPGGPVETVRSDPPHYAAGVRVARPWQPVPDRGPDMATLDEIAAFSGRGWLKFGMDFRLHELPGGRTRLETTTLCEPTDGHARRAFARYWRVIRPFSGLIRREMLRAVRRRAER
ncbi:hypothetical protein [Nocardioides sp.]|uniref:hypothetical protein n=1 Tax=Nocardioides sp. TaxID=35761 RepID=UPI003528A383